LSEIFPALKCSAVLSVSEEIVSVFLKREEFENNYRFFKVQYESGDSERYVKDFTKKGHESKLKGDDPLRGVHTGTQK